MYEDQTRKNDQKEHERRFIHGGTPFPSPFHGLQHTKLQAYFNWI